MTYETIGIDPLDLNMEPLGKKFCLTLQAFAKKLKRHSPSKQIQGVSKLPIEVSIFKSFSI